MSEKTTKELVLEGRDEGKVVFLQFNGDGYAVMTASIDEFIKQPADGILYDLNRLEEITLTFIDDPKWVNDFAVALTVRALKAKLSKMEEQDEIHWKTRRTLLAKLSKMEEALTKIAGAGEPLDEAAYHPADAVWMRIDARVALAGGEEA